MAEWKTPTDDLDGQFAILALPNFRSLESLLTLLKWVPKIGVSSLARRLRDNVLLVGDERLEIDQTPTDEIYRQIVDTGSILLGQYQTWIWVVLEDSLGRRQGGSIHDSRPATSVRYNIGVGFRPTQPLSFSSHTSMPDATCSYVIGD